MEFQKLFPHGIPFEKKTQIFPINVYGAWWKVVQNPYHNFLIGILIGRKEGELNSKPYKIYFDLNNFWHYIEPIELEEFWEFLPGLTSEELEEIEKELGEEAG